jgi:hypothetical protein
MPWHSEYSKGKRAATSGQRGGCWISDLSLIKTRLPLHFIGYGVFNAGCICRLKAPEKVAQAPARTGADAGARSI